MRGPSNNDRRKDIANLGNTAFSIGVVPNILASPFLSQLQGAFFALVANTPSCSAVSKYSCEYLQVPCKVDM
jgi:hypothetical protein